MLNSNHQAKLITQDVVQVSNPMLNYGLTRLTTPHWFHQYVLQCIPVLL